MPLFSSRELAIGAVGHRPNLLPANTRAGVAARQAAALGVIEKIGLDTGAKRFVLISALAEGADRYAAEAALARHWALEAPLPFSVKRYEEDFDEKASVKQFRALKKKARKVHPTPENDDNERAAYGAVGRAVADASDVVLCVWNGEAAKGPGGTAHVVALALAQGKPVVWLGVQDGPARVILPTKKAAVKGKSAAALREGLAEAFEATMPPETLRGALDLK
jgi:hypothetical protein